MNISCQNCSEEFNVSSKKWAQRRGRTHKIFICPHCFKKNIIPILMKYQKSDFDGEKINWYNKR